MNLLRNRFVKTGALTLFLGVIGILAFHLKFCVRDFDIWWHLKVGDWIVNHSALPKTGILSRTAADRPWVAYSWGYEVLLSHAYAWFGLIGIGVFGTALTIGVAFSVYWMLRRISGRFWWSYVLAVIASAAFVFTGMPRPGFFSEMLYCATLALLLESQRTKKLQPLYWLPAIFFLWANLHIQFIYGLFAVGLFVGVHLTISLLSRIGMKLSVIFEPELPLAPLLAVFGLCVLATLLGPNLYHPYVAVFTYTKAKFSYRVINELQPLNFRWPPHYIELFLAAAAFYVVGWQRRIDAFKLILLAVASAVAFRTMRDAWFLCISSAACLADFRAMETAREEKDSWQQLSLAAACVIVLLLVAAPATDFTTRGLDRAISDNYPVNAINFLRHTAFSGPLYNNLNWGGFLMWYMPDYPVAIDGRNDLYGDELDEIFYNTESAFASYKTDHYLDESGVVVLDSELPLAKILSIDPRFKLIFHDAVATVYVRQ